MQLLDEERENTDEPILRNYVEIGFRRLSCLRGLYNKDWIIVQYNESTLFHGRFHPNQFRFLRSRKAFI